MWKLRKFPLTLLQGDPNQNLKWFLATTLKLCISDLMLVKPICVWEAYNFFDFQLFVYNFQLFVYNFSKKLDASQTHFGFTNMGSEMHGFRVIAKRHFKFWFGSLCMQIEYIRKNTLFNYASLNVIKIWQEKWLTQFLDFSLFLLILLKKNLFYNKLNLFIIEFHLFT